MVRFLRFFPTKFVFNIATLGPLGRSRFMPGTWGSLAGVIGYTVAFWNITFYQFFIRFSLLLFIGLLFCDEAERRMGQKDPPSVILDEFCAMPLCFLGIERFSGQVAMWEILLCGFCIFRLLDVLKPFGIRALERFRGGVGIMADDMAAALATCLALHVIIPAALV
ncbi:MAG: phosphatidylglycerophosphatase A [Puniceicoccales bacterium]|jgi:phosphatidylglycerophosphatase A|nr:phosphatidylglycerophosphatase A [Puniceicoccales bacterium]